MEAAGLPSPKTAMIHEIGDCEAAAQAVGFPAVIKVGEWAPRGALLGHGVIFMHFSAALVGGMRLVAQR